MAVNHHDKWPIDFDALEPGDVITAEVIERAYNVQRGTAEFDLARLRLRREILKETRVAYCKTRGAEELVILTDNETADYLPARRESIMRQLRNLVRYGNRVNHSQLTTEQTNQLLHTTRLSLAAIQETRREQRRLRTTKGTAHALPAPQADPQRNDAPVDAQRATGRSAESSQPGDAADHEQEIEGPDA